MILWDIMSERTVRRTNALKRAGIVLALVLLAFVLPAAVFADGETYNVVPSSLCDKEYLADAEAEWEGNDNSTTSVFTSSEGTTLRVSGKGLIGARVECDGDAKDVKEVGVLVSKSGLSVANITVTAECDNGKVTATAPIDGRCEYFVFVTLPHGAEKIEAVSVTASFSDGRDGHFFLLSGVKTSKHDHVSDIKEYSAYTVTPENGNTDVTGNYIVSPYTGSEVAVRLRLSLASAGSVTFSYAADGENYVVCGSSIIRETRNDYLFRVGTLESGSSYKIEFSGIEDALVALGSVEFIPVSGLETPEYPATVTSCILTEEGAVEISGTVSHAAVIEYIDSPLYLYRVYPWQSTAEALEGEPLAETDMSTTFGFTVNEPAETVGAVSYFTAVGDPAVQASDEVTVSKGTYAPSAQVSRIADGVTPEYAFIAGYDGCVSDAYASELPPVAGTVPSLDRDAEFSAAAGMRLIVRLRLSPDKESVSPTSEEEMRTYLRAVTYLAGKYSPAAIIVSSDGGSLWEKAENTVTLVRAVSGAACEYSADTAVFTEISAAMTDRDGRAADTYSWLLSACTSKYPRCLWYPAVTSLPSGDGAVASGYLSGILSSLSDGGGQYAGTVVFGDGAAYASEIISGVSAGGLIAADVLSPDSEYGAYEGTVTAPVTDSVPAGEGQVLWDFTRAYESGGFVKYGDRAGVFTGGCAPMEEYTGVTACRTLMARLSGDSVALIARPPKAFPAGERLLVQLLFYAECERGSSFDILFISGENRISCNVVCDGSGIYSPVCDLTGLVTDGKVDRVALVMRDGERLDLDIAKITAYSDGAPTVPDTVTEGNRADYVTYAAIAAGVIITVAVFVFLSRKREK